VPSLTVWCNLRRIFLQPFSAKHDLYLIWGLTIPEKIQDWSCDPALLWGKRVNLYDVREHISVSVKGFVIALFSNGRSWTRKKLSLWFYQFVKFGPTQLFSSNSEYTFSGAVQPELNWFSLTSPPQLLQLMWNVSCPIDDCSFYLRSPTCLITLSVSLTLSCNQFL
jgi:hypothetical protein